MYKDEEKKTTGIAWSKAKAKVQEPQAKAQVKAKVQVQTPQAKAQVKVQAQEARTKAKPQTKAKPKPGRKASRKKPRPREVSQWWFIGAAAVLVVLFVLVPFLVTRCAADEGVRVPEGHYAYAVDISKYQKGINWDSLMVVTTPSGRTTKDIRSAARITRVRYVMIKATEGSSHKDALFNEHWKKSARAGYSRGAYHFFLSSKSPEDQARNFIRTVGNIRHKDLPPILDVETIHKGCTKELLNSRIKTWLETIEKHYGRKPVIYTSDAFLRDNLESSIVEKYPIWIARYEGPFGLQEPRFQDWMMWQFTDRASVYGIPAPCDLSVIHPSRPLCRGSRAPSSLSTQASPFKDSARRSSAGARREPCIPSFYSVSFLPHKKRE